MAEHSDEARIFDAAMSNFSSWSPPQLSPLTIFLPRATVVDIAAAMALLCGNSQKDPSTARRGRDPPCC